MVSKDFSFPKITNPLSQLTSLPSLWRVSSLIYPEYKENEDDVVREALSFQRKSFLISYLPESEANKRNGDDPEKMDMLWEEFNEELKWVSSLRSWKKVQAQAMKITKRGKGSGMICHKRQSRSMLAVMKSLKKIFYLHNLVRIKN